jgi:hypothetical protein
MIGRVIAPLAMVAALIALIATQVARIAHPAGSPAPAAAFVPAPEPRSALGTIEIGATTAPLAQNSWRAWTGADLGSVNAFERAVRTHAGIVMWYSDWEHSQALSSQLDAVQRRGSTPEITWEPWNAELQIAHQPRYALRNIIAGKFDVYIRAYARSLAAFGHPVLLRFAQEMNGFWYPWANTNGNRPGEFVRAWRHVHRIFVQAGATNVKWVWSPVQGAPPYDFPGAGEVDVLGLTCLNGGAGALGRGWRSFAVICSKSIEQLHALDPRAPIQLSETGSATSGGSKAAWISGTFRYLARHPEVKSVVWFNLEKKGVDWRVQSTPADAAAVARGVRLR